MAHERRPISSLNAFLCKLFSFIIETVLYVPIINPTETAFTFDPIQGGGAKTPAGIFFVKF